MPNGHKNRVQVCPQCGEDLRPDKKPDINRWTGVVYRSRLCPACWIIVHTKQGAEEITGLEKLDEARVLAAAVRAAKSRATKKTRAEARAAAVRAAKKARAKADKAKADAVLAVSATGTSAATAARP